jgi:glycine dehydrogenase subunit 1
MTYVPHTDADRAAMMQAIGIEDIEDLFRDVPAPFRFPELDLPRPLSEMEALRRLQALGELNLDTVHYISLLGAGSYDHYVPSVVNQLTLRSEFYTAYTPYQPEISQGTLQSIFEYQSMICELTGMDVANASHYDGATAAAEAVLMAYYAGRRKRTRVVVSPTLHPEYRQVIRTYTQGLGIEIVGDSVDMLDGAMVNWEALCGLIDDNTCCVIAQNPDFLGQLHALQGVADCAHANKALFVVSADPTSLGLFRPPGDYGADVVTGEGQGLGVGVQFGGPYLGIFACRTAQMRRMAGRLVGETEDIDGKRAYVLTLTAREQHIRRERATSNICTNQALCALAASIYLASLGKTGLRRIAELNYQKAHYAAAEIDKLPGFSVTTREPFFNEFAIQCPVAPQYVNDALLEHDIMGGYILEGSYPQLENQMLIAVTETLTRAEIDRVVDGLREVTA